MMDWQLLLSKRRLSSTGALQDVPAQNRRGVFERDWDRILFSTAFRRMHDKTQVFPLPDNDVVHSRLTHSLEVASVGRSLGKRVGEVVSQRHPALAAHIDIHDFGDIVAAGCLTHDIGNPPFGHAGENAIASFFASELGRAATRELAPRERDDFEHFEGNAQGFRVVTRLQLEGYGGLHLTSATLAAFSKYPRESGRGLRRPGMVSTKKHGFFQADAAAFEALAAETGLLAIAGEARMWARHPLAFLVEAADDICYSILDIEDGVRLRHVTADEAEQLLSALSIKISAAQLAACSDGIERVGYLRALAIGKLIEQCVEVFLAHEAAILAGTYGVSLADEIPDAPRLKALRDLAFRNCYRAPEVLEIELAGYEALGGLLATFVPAASAPEGSLGDKDKKTLALLAGRGVKLAGSPYERVLRVTDYVSGMTDRHALATFRRLTGITIPGRLG
ncbi:MAG TPA: dNTP triphosphohydrolase [Kofleriaceae bacterium]|nr:dNTP triphosphohydrolase [Kofleriaceae bacterium]